MERARRGKMDRRLRRYLKKESALREDPRLAKLKWFPGACKKGICGEEAACIPGPDFTHKCVCPSDLSAPTEDFLCLTRRTVPLTPRPIFNINIIRGSISPGGNRSTSNHEAENINVDKNYFQPGGGLVIGLLAFVLFFAVLFGAVFWWRKKYVFHCALKTHRRKSDSSPTPLSLSKGILRSYVPNPQYMTDELLPIPIIPQEALLFLQEIGEGCFGKVYKGELKKDDGSVEVVAVKVLKDSASKQAEEDFMREVEIMHSFRHENILALKGIVLKESSSRPWMVFEYMLFGDLAEVLRNNSQQFWNPVPGMKPLTKDSLLKISLQIAGGMKYLASQRFVHNDLACRNCLVGAELAVKIADFGMSRDIYTCDYYRIGGSKPVPLRWMSPESVMYRRFTLESDVWSYGVVLWEIYSMGKQPYFSLTNEEVVKTILQGVVLVPPDDCPSFISDLMKECWKLEPKDRIKFPEIYNFLKTHWNENETDSSNSTPESRTPRKEIVTVINEVPLPRPPVQPISPNSQDEQIELLDADNYLAPQTETVNEYFQPLPD